MRIVATRPEIWVAGPLRPSVCRRRPRVVSLSDLARESRPGGQTGLPLLSPGTASLAAAPCEPRHVPVDQRLLGGVLARVPGSGVSVSSESFLLSASPPSKERPASWGPRRDGGRAPWAAQAPSRTRSGGPAGPSWKAPPVPDTPHALSAGGPGLRGGGPRKWGARGRPVPDAPAARPPARAPSCGVLIPLAFESGAHGPGPRRAPESWVRRAI